MSRVWKRQENIATSGKIFFIKIIDNIVQIANMMMFSTRSLKQNEFSWLKLKQVSALTCFDVNQRHDFFLSFAKVHQKYQQLIDSYDLI